MSESTVQAWLCSSVGSMEGIDSLSQFLYELRDTARKYSMPRAQADCSADAYLTVKDCLMAKDVVEWAVKIH